MNKILFFDVETTGLDPRVHGIHQLAGEVWIGDNCVDEFEYKVKPWGGCSYLPEALKVSNTSMESIMHYHPEAEIFEDFSQLVSKHIKPDENKLFFLAGWRAPEFDVKFLKAFIDRYSYPSKFASLFRSSPIDIKVLATQYFINKGIEPENFHLNTIAKYFDVWIDETKLHTAYYDAYLSRKVYEIVK